MKKTLTQEDIYQILANNLELPIERLKFEHYCYPQKDKDAVFEIEIEWGEK